MSACGGQNTGGKYCSQPYFNPASTMTSYVDQGSCGVRGDDARADFSQCPNGHRQILHKPWDNNHDIIDGCSYYEWKVYKCLPRENTEPTPLPSFKPSFLTSRRMANLDLSQKVISSNGCTSVDDVVPTRVDWQGTSMLEQQYSDGLIRVSQITDVNTFLAFATMGGYCKMVLFEISRNSGTNQCSYRPLAARYNLGACITNGEYCTSYIEGTDYVLTGTNGFGYGIEELEFYYKAGTIVDSNSCSGEPPTVPSMFLTDMPTLFPSSKPSSLTSSRMVSVASMAKLKA